MKPCIGCKHLHISRGGIGYCQEHWNGYERIADPFTGHTRVVSLSKYQQGPAWPMRVSDMRDAHGPCGTEARLFAPGRMWRFLGWVESFFCCDASASKTN